MPFRETFMAVLAAAFLAAPGLHAKAEGNDPAYVGAAACGACHAPEYEAWQGSHHDLAMDHATDDTVLGDFDDAQVTFHGVTSRFFRRDGRFFVHTDGPDGALADFEVAYTFGVAPLQQYLVAFPDGRVQALPLAWDARPEAAGGQRWYHLYPDEPINYRDELHWTGLQQNWNYMCADCHSTNLRKNYDPATDRFATDWVEIDVACEACHGPGQDHVAWAAQAGDGPPAAGANLGLAVRFHDRRGVAWPMDVATGQAQRSGGPITRIEIGACAACHSRRGLVAEGRERDPVYLDHHLPALLTEGLYHPDGQIQDEVYVWGSFTQSKMHERGVTCSDCHDPHSLELRAEGANVCAQCHLPSTFATPAHTGHPENTEGVDCLSCHMPETTYMGVDPRRDHSMRTPRPDLSLAFGTPNACTACHGDQDDSWAAEAFARMYPEAKTPFQHWTTAFHQARAGLPQAEVSLLTVFGKADTPDIVRATAIRELAAYLSPLSGQVVERALRDDSGLVRLAALDVLEAIPPANRIALAGPLLDDPLRTVRGQAAAALAGTPMNQLDLASRGALQRAMKDYWDWQMLNADRPESGLNLGNLSLAAGNATQAERHYRQSLARDPEFTPARLNLVELYRNEGMAGESLALLRQGLEINPDDAALHHALGLALVRSGDTQNAVTELRRAVELAPEAPRFAYVLGVALNSSGQASEAVTVLEQAHERQPNNRELLFALATIERDRDRREQAAGWARALLALNPGDEAANRLLAELE